LVLFSIATGVRQGELLALRWCDIDESARTVTIQHAVDKQNGVRVLARPKSPKAQRTLALPALALRALELRRSQEADDRLLAGGDWQDLDLVFPSPTGRIRDRHAVTRGFRRILDRNEIEPIRWHALRRQFAALLQDQGIPLERLRDLMGHSALRVTEHYAYTMPETLRHDMGAIDAALRSNEGGTRVGDETYNQKEPDRTRPDP
jgi:integrase